VWFSQNRGTAVSKRKTLLHDLRNLAYQSQIVLTDPILLGHMVHISEQLAQTKTMFLLGKGQGEAIAKEGALKLKEVAYIHAEGYSTSALKHGPFALIDERLPIIILDIGDEYRDKTANALQEVLCRGAFVILITDADQLYPQSNVVNLRIKQNDTFSGILGNLVLQLLGYKMAIGLGLNPDFPRNLAKVVSVE
jgi:glucosamine--fructose-6-phosphate aminotransferase (isomerizing)